MGHSKNLSLLDIQLRIHNLLYAPHTPDALAQLEALESQLVGYLTANPDQVLLTLVHHASEELRQYSSTHVVLVMALCHLAAGQIPSWDDTMRRAVRLACLTMNVSMMKLQDELTQQTATLTAAQKEEVAAHPAKSEALLREIGCSDSLWLDTVRRHHDAEPGPLAGRDPAAQLARLIQRADVFASRISPRRGRAALPASSAAQFAYLGEDHNPDEAGAALIKAVGIYPPGCWVGLANGELAIVLKRGEKAHCPLVAALIGQDGIPLASPRLRDTNLATYGVHVSLAPDKIKYRPMLNNLTRLL